MKKVYIVLLDKFADWEVSYVSLGINNNLSKSHEIEYIGLKTGIIRSLGGLEVNIHKTLKDMIEPSAIILIGGDAWKTSDTIELKRAIDDAIKENVVVGAICGASEWLAANGLVDSIKHTSNGLDSIIAWENNTYNGNAQYVNEQVVVDHNVVSANGTAALEFSYQLQLLLEPDKKDMIDMWLMFHKDGYVACASMFNKD